VLGIKVCRGHLVEPRHRVGLLVLGSNSTNLGETAIIVRWGCTAVHPIVRRPGKEFPEPRAWRLGSHHAMARYRLLVCVPDILGISVTPVHARTP
jgi:hypothetical protein